ncbi:tRNA (adenine(22)-N(1))-methyltransferase [Halalkalibacillus halophilus]|uniref:tRNA (adenine(22)-N(1))-methyltransferase n=1 Tax=Halalkalibacillus halophilus TaxID=392827 RepID=UPI00042093A7|nr:tRNA (adenine(22)-N(1))-methyltransferase TrmK [Halalkalibacillus halophilus]
MSQELSLRLTKVKNFIPKDCKVIADIGSDHAYLPSMFCLENPNAQAIAGEINEGPLLAAKNHVENFHLSHRIDCRLGSGLEVLKVNEAECIVIAGMGGKLITTILNEGIEKISNAKRLILQPNIDAASIRQFAINHHFQIVEEEIFNEDGYIYEIIVLEPSLSQVVLTNKEIYLGPQLLKEKNSAFQQKWKRVAENKRRIIDQMQQAQSPDNEKINKFKQHLYWIEEELIHG